MKKFFVIIFFFFISTTSYAARQNNASRYSKELLKIEQYFSNLESFSAAFLQLYPDLTTSKGIIYVKKPNKMMLNYTYPSKMSVLLIANNVTYYDEELDEIGNSSFEFPLFQMLFASNIFSPEIIIDETSFNKNQFYVTLHKKGESEKGSIRIFFDKKISKFRSFEVIDNKGEKIQVMLEDVKANIPINDHVFTIQRKNFLGLGQ